MSSKSTVYYQRSLMGQWILRHFLSGQFVADTKRGFWSSQRMEAMRFNTEAEAQACAEYLKCSVTAGVRCNLLVVEPLFKCEHQN